MSFEDIIVEIQEKPLLWMSADPNHKNRPMRAKLWADLAMKLGIKEEVLKRRWKHLKDQYRKELKKKPHSRSGAEGDCKSSWKYFRSLEFIRNEVLPPAYNENLNPSECFENLDIQIEEDSTDLEFELSESFATSPASPQSSEPSVTQPTPSSRKRSNSALTEMLEIERKKMRLLEKTLYQNSEEESLRNDVDYLYLRSILPSMKKLTEYQKLCFRGKINDWLLEALTPNQD